MISLIELAERCEKATGPNFAMEQEIGAAIAPGFPGLYPAYTASIDAAMTLVPEGYEYSLGSGRKNALSDDHRGPWARVFAPDDVSAVPSLAATPAIALTAAALRARAASAIEARSGETTEIGSTEGESAVGGAETPKGTHP